MLLFSISICVISAAVLPSLYEADPEWKPVVPASLNVSGVSAVACSANECTEASNTTTFLFLLAIRFSSSALFYIVVPGCVQLFELTMTAPSPFLSSPMYMGIG